MSIGVRPAQNLFFAPTIPNSGCHQRLTKKWKMWRFHQSPFLPKKKKGNCLIEATLRIRAYTEIFRCFPNKGNTQIKATLLRKKNGPNKGNAFEKNLSKTVVATLPLFGGYPHFFTFLSCSATKIFMVPPQAQKVFFTPK